MKLSNLLSGYATVTNEQECEVLSLCLDSREVKPGAVFFACQGKEQDGRAYLDQAFSKGAAAVLCEAGPGFEHEQYLAAAAGKKIIGITGLSTLLGHIAARFYRHPSKSLKVVGVTGTNGKTSCCHFIAGALSTLNQTSGVIGTLGAGLYGHPLEPTLNTTPNAILVQAFLRALLDQGAETAAIEVSSHGLAQDRVEGVEFESAVFTNLSRDHLDYHGNMSEYGAAKKRLLEWPSLKFAVVNVDDPFGRQLIETISRRVMVIGFSKENDHTLAGRTPLAVARKVHYSESGIQAEVETPWGHGVLSTHLLGPYNLSNLLAALSVLCLHGISLDQALFALSVQPTVPGRLERFGGNEHTPLVIVDYAHTPDALEQVLSALKAHVKGALWCVFGCGGERDKGKRSFMAKAVQKWADHIIVTDDNPRTEDPKHIVADIMTGFSRTENVAIVNDRTAAIAEAIRRAHPGDIILVAGKGHENYQTIGTQKIPFSDVNIVKKILAGSAFCV